MDIYRTEEEQIEAIKSWWKSYGSAVVWGVIISLVIISGYRLYKLKSTEASEAAFSGFITVSEAFQAAKESEPDSLEDKTVSVEAEKLFKEYADHAYAHLASMMLAKHHVRFERWDDAEQVLIKALEQSPPQSMRVLMKSRLARVHIQKENYAAALDLIDSETHLGDFASVYEELKGDLYFHQEKYDLAREAYKKALDIQEESDVRLNNSRLRMKLEDLSVPE